MHYFDASALVKRYVRETGSQTVRRLLATGVAATSRLSEVEVASAIARRTREGVLSADQRDRVLAALSDDVPPSRSSNSRRRSRHRPGPSCRSTR